MRGLLWLNPARAQAGMTPYTTRAAHGDGEETLATRLTDDAPTEETNPNVAAASATASTWGTSLFDSRGRILRDLSRIIELIRKLTGPMQAPRQMTSNACSLSGPIWRSLSSGRLRSAASRLSARHRARGADVGTLSW